MIHPDYIIPCLLNMKLQDILHSLLIIAFVGIVIDPKLVGLVSDHTQKIVEIVILGLLAFVYYADLIFVKKQEVNIPPPQ